jgi:Flp pilus assembly protein protease CpaA
VVEACLVLIALIDIYSHRIPHWSLILLSAAIALSDRFSFHLASAAILIGISIVLMVVANMGAGDTKLLALLGFSSIPLSGISSFITVFTFSCGFLAMVHVIFSKTLKGRIALAPAIVAAYLLI